MCFWCSDIWIPADPREIAHSRVSQFLEIVNDLLLSMPFIYKPINPESISPTTSSNWLYTPCHCPPALITLRPGTRQLRTSPMPQCLLKLFKLANAKPAYPVSSILFHGPTIKALLHVSSLLPLPPDAPGAFCVALRGMVCPLFSGSMNSTNYLLLLEFTNWSVGLAKPK